MISASSEDPSGIRSARPEDASTIARFQCLMARETEELELDPDTVLRGVEAVFRDTTKGRYLVADQQGAVAGCLMVTPEWSDWRDGTVLWIQSLYVLPEHRRKGLYRAMYEHLRREVRDDPALRGIRLYVDRRNTPARDVYEALGMDGAHYQLFEWMKGA